MRIGLLTSGGDCQALNVTMRSLAKTLYRNIKNIEIIGFYNGYKGLMYKNYKMMEPSDFDGIINIGGTILGTSRCPFKKMREIQDGFDKVAAMKNTYQKLSLDALVILGGNGSIKTAHMLSQEGLNIIALPKTIDNDTWGTDYTFGYQSAINVATTYLDQIHTTAASHHRTFIIEVMGHKVGHICLSAGIASGADVILLPEIPFDIKEVAKAIQKRQIQGKNFSIIACAEGAISKEDAKLSKKDYKTKIKQRQGHSVIFEIAKELEKHIDGEIRTSAIGHSQRGGQPCPYDRYISTQFGIYGAQLLMNKQYNQLVVLKSNQVSSIPLSESAGKLKYVNIHDEDILRAKLLGISFGE